MNSRLKCLSTYMKQSAVPLGIIIFFVLSVMTYKQYQRDEGPESTLDILIASKFVHDPSLNTCSHPTQEQSHSNETSLCTGNRSDRNKIILFGNSWGAVGSWFERFGGESSLSDEKCSRKCVFSDDLTKTASADAVLYASFVSFKAAYDVRTSPSQRIVYVDVEAPSNRNWLKSKGSNCFNWTMTYHRQADVPAYYGYMLPHSYSVRPHPANMIESNATTLSHYLEALASYNSESKVVFPFINSNRSEVVAWMSSHCRTSSLREKYVKSLSKYIKVGTYGACGTEACGKRNPLKSWCWKTILAPNYKFYLAMENSFCQDYVTEKLYNPLLYGMVPVVYGGANYSRFLPPNSFIDARNYHPEALASHLKRLANNSHEYAKYHVWRHFWTVHVGGSFCELCMKLHEDNSTKFYRDIRMGRIKEELCTNPSSLKQALN